MHTELVAERRHTGTREYWNEALETMPWKEVERWQSEQIGNMLLPLRERSGLYRTLHADLSADLKVRSLADLSKLPFTMKDAIRNAQDQASDTEPFGGNQSAPLVDIVQAVSSSGTTGRPLYYALTQRDMEVWSDAIANNFFTAGVRKSDVVAHLVGLPMVAGGLPYADGFRRIGATLCWLGGFPTDRILREMRRLRTSALLATTSFGLYLTEQWDAVGRETGVPSALRKVLCGGEPGLNQPEIRDRIMRGLGISQLREVMGLGDVISGMWGECEEHDGMHFNAQKHVAIELIEPDTGDLVPWEAGATGEIVYTTFARDATPLVRYRSRDHALVIGTECACGRTSPRIRCIGRTDDMLIYKGMNVFPTAIRDLVTERFAGEIEPMLRIWKERADQVRFDDPIPVDVEAHPSMDAGIYPGLAEAIVQCVRTQLQVRIAVTVLAPGSLPRSVYKNSLLAIRGAA
ncbi:benzoylacetate-CoA ligase Bal [Aromatoleum bremense]|uniref:Benzoylacetate-CoA ligase Bal n=1 Tax=Aromatoleum bremense TaxID=76115 RepID=A0ABX1NZA9_9RHOO|nr:benzoylacetate-CoA ligase Bal [Aromatoleum bremense]NMG17183.1 benzoylacetate-CoA ligase Bal [Aromatoleum bremense]QTQ29999.1 Benzoylacetate-CoA ligase [Aromatoleum bremense]